VVSLDSGKRRRRDKSHGRDARNCGASNRDTLGRQGRFASQCPGRRAEADSHAEAETARSRSQRRVPSDNANHSDVIGLAAVTGRAACEGWDHWQLRRWVRNELPVRQQTLGGV